MASSDEGLHSSKLTSVTVMRSSAAERNKASILEAVKRIIVPDHPITVLEIASGTGQHVIHLAEHLPFVTWQPSECDQKSLTSIQSYIQITQKTNIRDAVWIDTTDAPANWANGALDRASFDALLCINMLHVCQWKATEGLFKGCEYFLKKGGMLIVYGPFKVEGQTSPENNIQLDSMLRQQNIEWGLRETAELKQCAKSSGMTLENLIDMPSNHKMLVFRMSED